MILLWLLTTPGIVLSRGKKKNDPVDAGLAIRVKINPGEIYYHDFQDEELTRKISVTPGFKDQTVNYQSSFSPFSVHINSDFRNIFYKENVTAMFFIVH